jgi:hypothetical protein
LIVTLPLAAEMSNCAPAPESVRPLDEAMLPLPESVSSPPAVMVVEPV